MRIAFLCGNVFDLGGVQRVTTTISNFLSEKNEVFIICTNSNIKINYELYGLNKNIKIVNIENNRKKLSVKILKALNIYSGIFNRKKYLKILKRIYYSLEFEKKIIDFLNENEIDIIIGCEGLYSIFLGSIKNKINSKVIGWEHNSFDAYLNTKLKYYWNRDIMFQEYLKILDGHIVLTENDNKGYLGRFGIESKVIYNPLSFKCENKSNLNNKLIIAVGRLTYQKGFDTLILIFSKFIERNKEWRLKIVGDGEEFDKLRNLIKEYKLEAYVSIQESSNKIQDLIREASIYAMSSRWEGFGLVVTEALELGLPVVSFKTTGPKEILEGYNCGYIVENGDLDLFAERLLHLAENCEEINYMSKNAKERAKDFYIEVIGSEWEKYLISVLEKKELKL